MSADEIEINQLCGTEFVEDLKRQCMEWVRQIPGSKNLDSRVIAVPCSGVAGGINAMDLLLANVKGLEVTNGYLKILPSDEVGGMSGSCT